MTQPDRPVRGLDSPPHPWDRAVADADADAGTTLEQVCRDELINLWSDLASARSHAINGVWSMQCNWITERIIVLTRHVGLTPKDQVPTTLSADGTYDGIVQAAKLA
jgi:hypothetical protein